MLVLDLRLLLKDKGGTQHFLVFVGSNLGVEVFLQKWDNQKRMRWNWELRHPCILCSGVSRKFYAKPAWLLFIYLFFVIKGVLKTLFSFIPWLLDFSVLPNYCSNLRKRYTIGLFSKCLVRNTLLPIGSKVPPTLWYPLPFP